MRIRTNFSVTLDRRVSAPDGRPALGAEKGLPLVPPDADGVVESACSL